MRQFSFYLAAFLAGCLPLNLAYAKPAVEVIAYQASIESNPQIIKSLGVLQASHSTQLSANAADTIKAIHFQSGQMVKQGDLLLELKNAEELAALQEAQALEQEALAQYQRVKRAVKTNTVTQSLVDEKYREWLTAIAQRKIIQASLNDRKIVAPFSGQLGFSTYTVGTNVSEGEAIVSLDDINSMKLDMYIPNRYLTELKIGQPVTLTTSAFGKQVFHGHVSAISPRLQASTRLLQIQATIPNSNQQLKANMMAQAQIQLEDKQQLTIPNTALLMLGDKEFVYRLTADKDNLYKAEKVLVESGEIGASRTEILSGLNAGDIVVSQGVMRVNRKTPVAIKGMENHTSQEQLLQPSKKAKQSTQPPVKNP
ncbi:MexH family multidrug efflux RND transporter periplasmic adaptor subunit [Thiomicrorhabdus immobilis]|uniref:MexH family multidrug efflux RND transporter periplasmic adaptor subunit n=1 Tax=Thiomicrorhabdus immobilis TaxID=2791037 RepID=A0ABN6CTN8_9GAMM|nr:efflux RND transporter periplasmic adaptor subunit [Thiomicrorhabdus immobilis]BCN92301.1 MexH family multidrug efflux RND transporter periplasmic adaptor subunit [Thiomicrorhabdus immobilis]